MHFLQKLIAQVKNALDPVVQERKAYEAHMSQANSVYDIEYYDRQWNARKRGNQHFAS
jgi:hypothetical protein